MPTEVPSTLGLKRYLCFCCIFSLDKSSVDERVRKDMTDYIGLRINGSTSLMANVTPTSNGRVGNSSNSSSNSNNISDGPQERFLQHLTDLCKGNFLHAKLTLELIERGHLVIKSGKGPFRLLDLTMRYQKHDNLITFKTWVIKILKTKSS